MRTAKKTVETVRQPMLRFFKNCPRSSDIAILPTYRSQSVYETSRPAKPEVFRAVGGESDASMWIVVGHSQHFMPRNHCASSHICARRRKTTCIQYSLIPASCSQPRSCPQHTDLMFPFARNNPIPVVSLTPPCPNWQIPWYSREPRAWKL